MKMKVLVLLSALVATSISSFAQVRLEPFWPFSKYSLGVGIGNSHMYGDLDRSISQPVYVLNFARNFNSYTSVGIEATRGALNSEEYRNHWTNGMSMYNQYTSVNLNGTVSLGQFFKYPSNYLWKNLFGLYFRCGIGVMFNDISNITYKFKNRDRLEIRDYNAKYIKTNEFVPYIPYNFGFNLHLKKNCYFNINYQFNYTFSDYVDGYNFSNPPANNFYNDMYSVLSFNLCFYLGHIYDTYYDENGIKEYARHLSD
jgi:hypothetical protein